MRPSSRSGAASSSSSFLERGEQQRLSRLYSGIRFLQSGQRENLQRPFSEFATGRTALGLLLIRLALGAAVIWSALPHARGEPIEAPGVFHLLLALTGVLIAAGYRTRFMGSVTAASEIWLAVLGPGDPLIRIVLATLAGVFVLLGPGAWSIDARRTGWKRIDIPKRQP